MCTILKSENGERRPKTKERGNKEIEQIRRRSLCRSNGRKV
jgi:hypothetical protein